MSAHRAVAHAVSVRRIAAQLLSGRRMAAQVVAVGLLSASCDGPSADAPVRAAIVRDSAGVEIIEEPLSGGSTLSLIEELRIGSFDGADHEQFYQIAGIGLTEDGDLVVFDTGNFEVRVFTADGRFLRSWGSKGEGPGEFRYAAAGVVGRDTVLVSDFDRYHLFTVDGRHVSTVRNPRDREAGVMEYGAYGAGDGWRVQTIHVTMAEPSESFMRISRYDPVGGMVGETVHEYRMSGAGNEPVPGTWLTVQPAFVPRTWATLDPTGRIFRPPGAPYEVRVYANDGVLERIVRPVWQRRVVTDEIMEGWWAFQRDRMCDPQIPPETCTDYEEKAIPVGRSLPRPEYVPPISSVVPSRDGDGAFLVLRRDIADDLYAPRVPVYDRFGEDGRFRGRFRTPMGFSAYLFSGDTVIGVLTDELEVPHVVRYRIVESSS